MHAQRTQAKNIIIAHLTGRSYDERVGRAIEIVMNYLYKYDNGAALFASYYFGLGGYAGTPFFKRSKSAVAMSLKLNLSLAALYKWRERTLDHFVLALAQFGLIVPFPYIDVDSKLAPLRVDKVENGSKSA